MFVCKKASYDLLRIDHLCVGVMYRLLHVHMSVYTLRTVHKLHVVYITIWGTVKDFLRSCGLCAFWANSSKDSLRGTTHWGAPWNLHTFKGFFFFLHSHCQKEGWSDVSRLKAGRATSRVCFNMSYPPVFLRCCENGKLTTLAFKLVHTGVLCFGRMFLQKRIIALHRKMGETRRCWQWMLCFTF